MNEMCITNNKFHTFIYSVCFEHYSSEDSMISTGFLDASWNGISKWNCIWKQEHNWAQRSEEVKDTMSGWIQAKE